MEIEQPHVQHTYETPTSSQPQYPFRSLVDSLADLSIRCPLDIAFTFLPDGEETEQNLTFRELDLQARSIANHLRRTIPFGARAGLLFESGLDYITALVGCFNAGIVAVPIYPPDPLRWTRTVSRMQAILDDAQTDVVLTTQDQQPRLARLRGNATVIATDVIASHNAIDSPIHTASHKGVNGVNDVCSGDRTAEKITPDTLALLQYTSGSTGSPKGVMLTHANLMFNFEHIKKFDEPNAVAVSWLPMYHDMGLIGLVLHTLQSGRRTILMSPLSFIKRPQRWLQAISKYGAYATSGPSFAYELCVRKIDLAECEGIDLSGWTLAGNGAEPVRADTLKKFAKKFAPLGFRWESAYPGYGLAEATLIVSGGAKSAAPVVEHFDSTALDRGRAVVVSANQAGARTLVGCGKSVASQQMAIVDPTTRRRCPDNVVGEIWVCGPGVAQGYWNNPAATKHTFAARTHDGDGPFLRTGDLGFLRADELFVTGRLKDLIIIRGRNHYPQEIERTVERCLPVNRAGPGVAFAVDFDGQERMAVVQNVVRLKNLDAERIFADIRQALLHEHEVAPHVIVLVKGGEIPHTSSGKVQRRACRELFLAGKLSIVAQWDEASEEPIALTTDRSTTRASMAATFNGNGSVEQGRSDGSQQNHDQIIHAITQLLGELKNGKTPPVVDPDSMLFADLALESIDVAVLTELIERHYQRRFPFIEFMTDLGRRKQRDVSMRELASFVHNCLVDVE